MAGLQVLIIEGGRTEQSYSSDDNVSRETSFRSGLILVAFVGVFFCVRRVY